MVAPKFQVAASVAALQIAADAAKLEAAAPTLEAASRKLQAAAPKVSRGVGCRTVRAQADKSHHQVGREERSVR